MKIHETGIPDLLLIEPTVFPDSRGFFFESYNESHFQKNNIHYTFRQDNISKSVKNTVRGLHYQIGDLAQGKLCQVLQGEVLDVAVDIRFGSPTFGKSYSVLLNEQNHLQLLIPPGFAHGFSVLSETAVFMYKCTQVYSKPHERAIIYCDTDLNIDWKISGPMVSEKDLLAPSFRSIERDFNF